ncbi:MAG TPA: terminase family protein [Terriglobia bacterium]|nr:terminase family protein [Terriglobia bacterium]
MTTELRLRPQQGRVFLCPRRFIVLVAGRRWGKTTLAVAWLIRHALQKRDAICYYLAPTYRQAKRIAWKKLLSLVPPHLRRAVRKGELELGLCNSSIIQLHGASHADALRGLGVDAIVLDEYATMKSQVWDAVIRPMLSDRLGQALFIGTPQVHNQFYDLYVAAQSRRDWAAFHFPTREGGYVSLQELEALRCEMDARLYRQEYEASFETLQGRVYYAFSREANVTNLVLLPDAPLLIGMDFNINPMTAVVAQRAGDQCQVIDEIVLPNSNTQEMMQAINRRYPGRKLNPNPNRNPKRS